MIDSTYKATIQFDRDPGAIDCVCDGGCDWKGTADRLRPIGDAILTPGHASPAGRCPVCDTLAYPAITDSGRLDFIEQHPEMALRASKKKWAFIGFTNYPFTVFGRLREALDHAIKGYPGD